MKRLRALTALCAIAMAVAVHTLAAPDNEADVRVSWLTCAPGPEPYQLEGHAALRIVTPTRDYVVNWGVFDFAAPAFLWRFCLGRTDYMAQACPTRAFVAGYTYAGRWVREQQLNLSPAQTARLVEMVDSTLQPGCNTYRYNYVLDNCATRPLDYIARTAPLAGGEALAGAPGADAPTFRSEMKRYHSRYPWYQFGIDLALGSLIDKPLTRRQTGFAPVEMMSVLGELRLPDGSPLASEPVVINHITAEPPQAPTHFPGPVPTCWVLAALVAAAAVLRWRRGRGPGAWIVACWFGVEGLMGLALTFLIFVSSHYATSPNWVYLWLNPLALLPVVLIWSRSAAAAKILTLYFALNIVALLALAVIFITGVQGGNAAFWPLMLGSAIISLHYLWHTARRHTA